MGWIQHEHVLPPILPSIFTHSPGSPQQELLADDVELEQLPQPCELTLVLQHPGWDGIFGTKHDTSMVKHLQII